MKHILILALFLLLLGCSSDSNPEDGLPPETQIGANTFGCLIDGELYKPRCEEPSVAFPQWGMIVWGSPSTLDYSEIEVRDIKSEYGFNLLIHLHSTNDNREGTYQIDDSDGNDGIDGLNHTYLHCIIYDKITNGFKKYISFFNSGKIILTKYGNLESGNPNDLNVISGTFNCKLRNITDANDEIEITKGRFDINTSTVIYKEFP